MSLQEMHTEVCRDTGVPGTSLLSNGWGKRDESLTELTIFLYIRNCFQNFNINLKNHLILSSLINIMANKIIRTNY